MNKCGGCGKDFGGLRAFDNHRAGSFEKRTRHCLNDEQMVQKGLTLGKNGIWSTPAPTLGIVVGIPQVSLDDEKGAA